MVTWPDLQNRVRRFVAEFLPASLPEFLPAPPACDGTGVYAVRGSAVPAASESPDRLTLSALSPPADPRSAADGGSGCASPCDPAGASCTGHAKSCARHSCC